MLRFTAHHELNLGGEVFESGDYELPDASAELRKLASHTEAADASAITVEEGGDESELQSQEDGEAAYAEAWASGAWYEGQIANLALDALFAGQSQVILGSPHPATVSVHDARELLELLGHDAPSDEEIAEMRADVGLAAEVEDASRVTPQTFLASLKGPQNSVVASDLVAYCAANMPNDDVSTAGGAIDTLRRIDFTQMAANDTVRFKSSSASDTTQTGTITGRKTDGTVATETLTINGTTNVTFANTYERLIKFELSATCLGTVTVERVTGSVLIRTIPIGERGFLAIFRQLASDPVSAKDYYCKFFWKNTNGSLALTVSYVKENSDPPNRVTHALATTLDDSGSVANRVTAPGGLTFDGTDKNVPNSQNLSFGSAIGCWLHLSLPGGDAANKATYISEIDGQTV